MCADLLSRLCSDPARVNVITKSTASNAMLMSESVATAAATDGGGIAEYGSTIVVPLKAI
eukprot:CAMPEP_0182943220 /NCGR_PEP_ID=MMETSP0105_2-20130417/52017_1 /TAXON_ID=81532 ORGANISM="Acanthoeca-like sp., Strain 10tr" /NCGR_SAMPLE_ID=MMETSP0105_2 /ASSEMBLY_ACC=CAM_ASM_000205 /LENGTH=59 /DNA_ID=CAMNT_0025083045 /DNA_START=41 /DNA_END=217 /DNA_ORIENTATION=-